jgi:eukaryotic-like serine/threonine-protein kinase
MTTILKNSSTVSTPNQTALVVGIDAYPSQPLTVCVHDAIEMGSALAMPEYGFTVSKLLDHEATRRSLKKTLEAFFRTVASTYLFYFSGHGWATDIGVYLMTVDGDDEDEGVDLDYVRRLITNLVHPDASVVMILDCCHSGAATAKAPTSGVKVRSQDVVRAIPSLPQGRVLMAACRGDQLAYEDMNLGHGVFTFSLLRGLLGEAADTRGDITVTGLHDFVAREVALAGLQTPVFRGDIAGRLILGSGLSPQVQPVLTDERAVELEREAQRFLQDYQSTTASSYGDLSRWKAEGHKAACQTLEPLLNWFERRLGEFPYLKERTDFLKLKEAAIQRLAYLQTIDIDTITPLGIVKEKLGSGNFGTVWKIDPVLASAEPALAYKIYHPQDFGEHEKVRRFRRGYEAMNQLDHPYIVKVQKYTNCPMGFFMNFIDGPNLRNFTGTLDEPKNLISLLLTIAETIAHAHARSVVHRDVKPENIIMSFDASHSMWRPYLTDFDLAWFSTASKLTKDALGTVQYSAPEQWAAPMSASAHAPTTDSYSFGQLAFFTVTGSDPVPLNRADNSRALQSRLQRGWFEGSAQDFLRLYNDCTEHQPNRRPQLDEICERLFRISGQLHDLSPSTTFTDDRFIKELVFSMVGLSSDDQGGQNSFETLSGKNRISISIKNSRHLDVDLSYVFSADVGISLAAGSFSEMRRTTMNKIRDAINDFSEKHISSDLGSPFQVTIDHYNVPLNLDGLALSRALIRKVIDAMETA